ncbi:MAG: glutamine synthetase [Calditrichaeota bacterium]|nr:glutamine synthetase [Calditrichota bacterium]
MHQATERPRSLVHLLDKARHEITRSDLLNLIESRQIRRITLHYTGLDSKLKELKIPLSSRAQAERVLAEGERVDGSSLFRGLVDSAVSDLYVVPLYKTAFLNPFEGDSLDFMCRYLDRKGQLAPYTLDSILHNAMVLFRRQTGLSLYGLGELEFFLLSDQPGALYPNARQHGYHATAPFVKSGSMVSEMALLLNEMTGLVKYAHSEVGGIGSVRSNLEEIKDKHAEQMEIEFLPAPLEEAGDILVLARWLIRNVAYRHGSVATFAPKLEEGVAGNGLHIHLALHRDGENIMADSEELSSTAKMLIGGLCHYAASLTAFGNTTSSAYLRLVPNQEAPTHICWSDLNRSALIRVPLAWNGTKDLAQTLNPQQHETYSEAGSQQTVELRSPDGSAIVHLLLAGIAMAAEWGINGEKGLAIAEKLYVAGNIFKNEALLKELPVLPVSCVDSAGILLNNRALYERSGIFPPSVIDYLAQKLQAENDAGINRYLADLPADDRLLETRKIMHRDLHRH